MDDSKRAIELPDGTIYAGISPDTGKPMYTTPADAPLTMKWREAMDYAAGLEAHGHNDWRVPSKAELHVLFENRAKIGGFCKSGQMPPDPEVAAEAEENVLPFDTLPLSVGWYWASQKDYITLASCQRFTDGQMVDGFSVYDRLSVRCVRG